MRNQPDAFDLLASTGDLMEYLRDLTGDDRFARAAGVLRGKQAGRPACDDSEALKYARSLLDAGLARSTRDAARRAAVMYAAGRVEITRMRGRLQKKLTYK